MTAVLSKSTRPHLLRQAEEVRDMTDGMAPEVARLRTVVGEQPGLIRDQVIPGHHLRVGILRRNGVCRP